MIILFGGEKGGTGKTTLCVNMAGMRMLAGRDVLLIDADSQGSASAWAALRDESMPLFRIPCIQKFGDLRLEIGEMSTKYQDVLIDAGGRDSPELRSAMVAADKVFTPMKPSQFDVWSLEQMERLIGQASSINHDLQALVVINQANPNPRIKETVEARDFIGGLEHLKLARTIIRDRIAFRKAIREGLSIQELKGVDPKSKQEMKALYQEVFGDE